MSDQEMDTMSVKDWERYLSNRDHTRDISYHGGANHLSIKLRHLIDRPNCAIIYSKIVQATLNLWEELACIVRDPFEVCPIDAVASAVFVGDDFVFNEALATDYCRLWKESPRPYTDTHKHIALNSADKLPVTRAEVEFMFELSDVWSYVAVSIASNKGWNTDANIMIQKMFERKAKLCYWHIVTLIEKHKFPRKNGILWLEALGYGDKPAVERWKSDITSSS